MLLQFRRLCRKSREKRDIHHVGTEDAAMRRSCCEVRDDLYIYRACLPVRCLECREGGPAIYSGGL